ncbi:MAG: hypothetical protein HGA85_05935, partial [Nanoarchaeota archaeon]|nr:hypothetical protein [Nanoarchaeota archaeon]
MSQKNDKVKSIFYDSLIICEESDAARELYNSSRFGELTEEGRLQLSLIEGLYLLEKEKIEVYDRRHSLISYDKYVTRAVRHDKNL